MPPQTLASRPEPYRVILFDCVNTLYLPDASLLPRVEVAGRQVPSTAPVVWQALQGPLGAHLPPAQLAALNPAALHQAARNAWRWAEQARSEAHREVPAPARFAHLLRALGVENPPPELVQTALDAHFSVLRASFVLPPAHRALLERLRPRFRLALLSNFDHAPALRRILADDGVADWLEPLLISDELGWRKPGAQAFALALAELARLGVAPAEVLFVGDSPEDDVRGGRQAGLDVAWINPAGNPLPAGIPQPTAELAELAHLERLPGLAPRD